MSYDVKPIGYRANIAADALKGLDGLFLTSPENVFYVTGASTLPGTGNPILFALRDQFPTFAYIDQAGATTLFIWAGAAMGVNYQSEVRPFSTLSSMLEDLLEFMKEKSVKVLGVEPSMPLYVRDTLLSELGSVELRYAGDVMLGLRMVKSPGEVELIRRATRIAEEGVMDAVDALRAGMSSRRELAALCRRSMVERGATAVDHITLAFGASNPEVLLNDRLDEGQLVTLDLGAVLDGYVSDIRRYASMSQPQQAVSSLHDKVAEIVQAVGSNIRQGIRFSDIYARAVEAHEERGLTPMFYSAGHSIGITTEEAWITGDSQIEVKEGMVLNVELYQPTEEGIMVGDEETYVVTSSGAERLNALPKNIVVVRAGRS